MAKRKPQIEIGKRAFEEVYRIWNTQSEAKKALGVRGRGLIYDWSQGMAPSAMYLQRLHYCGADVIYILTGMRQGDKK